MVGIQIPNVYSYQNLILTDNCNIFFVCSQDEFPCQIFGDSFGDDGHGLDAGELHGLQSDVIGRPEGSKVDHHVHFRVLGNGLADCCVN